jgi:acyl carrier protein
MTNDADRNAVAELVIRFAPALPGGAAVAATADLVRDLGYHSVQIVELLLGCEQAFDVTLPVEAILLGPPLTPEALVAHLQAARARQL